MTKAKTIFFTLVVILSGLQVSQAQSFEEKTVVSEPSSTLMEKILEEIEFEYSPLSYNKYKIIVDGWNVLLIMDDNDIMLYSVFEYDGTVNRINDWNRTKKFSRSYVDTDGDAVLESELSFEGGVTAEAILNFINTYTVSLDTFVEHIE